ncbi:hypothetical protein LJC74_03875 [Eubacteriales bacterium OttesenSCG-928-A19]|nr:hypothetical protein [Eubacteriales bacterium OttesenSCG-928-A19]
MTLAEFRALVASLPETMDRVHCRGLKGTLPRAVWQEARIEQVYASNQACVEKTTIALEYITKDEEDPGVQAIKDMFRSVKMPFVCEVLYDEDKDEISYMFNVWLEEDL